MVLQLRDETKKPAHTNKKCGQKKTKQLKIIVMKTTIKISDFSFQFAGYGHYKVTYTSPVTGKSWTATTNNMPLIDDTKNADEPLKKDLQALKFLCKN